MHQISETVTRIDILKVWICHFGNFLCDSNDSASLLGKIRMTQICQWRIWQKKVGAQSFWSTGGMIFDMQKLMYFDMLRSSSSLLMRQIVVIALFFVYLVYIICTNSICLCDIVTNVPHRIQCRICFRTTIVYQLHVCGRGSPDWFYDVDT